MRCFHSDRRTRLWVAELGNDPVGDVYGVLPDDIDVVYSAVPNREHYPYWKASVSHADVLAATLDLLTLVDADVMVLDLGSVLRAFEDEFRDAYPYQYQRPVVYEAPMSRYGRGTAHKAGFTQAMFSRVPLDVPARLGLGSREGLTEVLDQLPAASTLFDPFIGKGLALQAGHAAGLTVYGSDVDPDRLAACTGWLETKDAPSDA